MLNFNWFKRIFKDEPEEPKTAGPVFPMIPPGGNTAGSNVWAVGGGKGGVGKSLIASSIGIALSKTGKSVLMIDADLGAANLHTFLGVDGGRAALSSFLKEEVSDLSSLIMKTPVPGLDLISGARDSLDIADIKGAKISRLKQAVRRLDYDYVIFDIGPGTSSNLLDMFLMSNEGIILATPEPTTIENNYRFLKCLFLRKIKALSDTNEDGRLKDILQKIFSDRWPQRVKTVSDILAQLTEMDYELGRSLREHIAATNISMIMNQARKDEDKMVGPAIRRACADYFGVDIGFLGAVSYEEAVTDSIRMRKPLLMHYAHSSSAAREIEDCVVRLLNRQNGSETPNTF